MIFTLEDNCEDTAQRISGLARGLICPGDDGQDTSIPYYSQFISGWAETSIYKLLIGLNPLLSRLVR